MRWLIFLLLFFPLCNSATELFYDNFEGKSVCGKSGSCNWYYSNGGGGPSPACAESTAFAASGKKSLKCTSTYPDTWRREVVLSSKGRSDPNYFLLKQDKEYWIGQSYYIPKWPADGRRGEMISQIHNRDDGCDKNQKGPFAIAINEQHIVVVIRSQKDTAACSNGHTERVFNAVHPIIVGEWFDMVINYLPDVNGNGKVKVWINNKLVVNYSGKVSYNNKQGDFWKQGLYRASCRDQRKQFPCSVPTRDIYFDEFRIVDGKDKYNNVKPSRSGGLPKKLPPPTQLKIIQN